MKIAFVNQPIDAIVPPYQNSVGACTYWVARPLAKSTEVLVYGLKDLNPGDPAALAAELRLRQGLAGAEQPAETLDPSSRLLAQCPRPWSGLSTSRRSRANRRS